MDLGNWTPWNDVILSNADTNLQSSCVGVIPGGGLRITAKDEMIGDDYQSGLIDSVPKFLYGYFECRCKVPTGKGLWPAFWLYGVEDSAPKPEIDIFEYIQNGVLYCTNWLNGGNAQENYWVGDMSTAYHKIAAKWESDKVSFFYDDILVAVISERVPTSPLSVMLDLFVGGTWAGSPDEDTVFPAYLDIDYVKIWQKP